MRVCLLECLLRYLVKSLAFKVIGIRPLAPVQNSVSLKLLQRKTLNFVIILPDVENITKLLVSILTKFSIIKRSYTPEFILGVQSQICSIFNNENCEKTKGNSTTNF